MSDFKFTGVAAHGGDVQLHQIDPSSVKLASAKRLTQVKDLILARGETSGHCHILTGDVEVFELDGFKFACVGKDGAYHQHYKEAMVEEKTFTEQKNISNCDHTKECKIPEGTYMIGIDQQYNPHEGLFENNKD